ncbi:MAG: TIGR01906 family membrane protein [Anaerolineales bacterium]|jgi:integral membrane protein (TIGR01906 family)
MNNPNPGIQVLSWLVTILVPVALVLTAVRLLLTPVFVQFEYRTPNFPPDPYGFTQEDRLYWSQIALNYLLNDQGISYLGDLRFPDGNPLYNQRELKHMADVKKVVQAALKVWVGSLAGLALLGVLAWRAEWLQPFRHGLSRGGWLTVLLVGTVILFVLVGFGVFFVFFHDIFFAPGTWSFSYSDTLIRLFPERFWRDTFLVLGVLSGGVGLALGYIFQR